MIFLVFSGKILKISRFPQDFPSYPPFSQQNTYDPYFYSGFPGVPQGKAKKFTNEFPRAKNYNSLESIGEAFPHLKDVNKNFDEKNISNARCFVMRSNNDDDIHKVSFFFMFCLWDFKYFLVKFLSMRGVGFLWMYEGIIFYI